MSMERRAFGFELKAVDEDGEKGTFSGYGSVFNTIDSYNDTIVKGAYRSTLKEWKAKKKLPKMLLQHGGGGFFSSNADDMIPLGKWDEMYEDDHGLFMKGRIFDIDTDRAKATYAALKAGEMDGLSIGFKTVKSKMDEETGVRTLTEIKLFEVSLVTFPANDPARVTEVRFQSNVQDAVKWLKKAIARHERHMNGTEATDDASQQLMMDEMRAALASLDDKASMSGGMAGVLPTEREIERFLRREAGFTEAQAKGIVAKGYRQVRREAMPSEEACGELAESIRRYGAIAGEQKSWN